jgi:RimJ/RimL family protein N-acetyltransferase
LHLIGQPEGKRAELLNDLTANDTGFSWSLSGGRLAPGLALCHRYICSMLTTKRLQLRLWRDEDLAAFATLNADPRVMRYMGV